MNREDYRPDSMNVDYSALDEALAMLRAAGPEYAGGLSNHGPMAAEALSAMGRAAAVMPWVERYRSRLDSRPSASARISPREWRSALGDSRRVGDWSAFFERELDEADWREVVERWAARLAPGVCAAAFHGVIRTAHAARSLAAEPTKLRLGELADGLGYWAATYQTLPAQGAARRGSLASRAISRVRRMPEKMRSDAGSIVERLEPLARFPEFPPVLAMAGPRGNVDAFLSDLTETFARAYLANARGVPSAIAFVHCVTGPAAIRTLASVVSARTAASLARYGWQAAAAVYAAIGTNPPADFDQGTDDMPGREELFDRAVANRDEHAIKFTEACTREYALNPRSAYIAAALHALSVLGR